jgi:hypothetical protein
MPMPAATLTRRIKAHYRLSPRRCRGLTASGTALRSICLSLGVVGRVAASGDAHAAHAALSPVPPTLSGVNCKRDRVAVDLSVSWRCWRACLCQRRRSRSACRTIACPPTLSGVTANETALRSICLFLGVVGGHAYAGGDAHTAHQGVLLHLLHSAADTQSHAETTWRTISSRANPQSSLSEMNLVKLDGFGYIPAFNNTPLTEALQEQAKIHINRQINTPAQLRADYRAARKC